KIVFTDSRRELQTDGKSLARYWNRDGGAVKSGPGRIHTRIAREFQADWSGSSSSGGDQHRIFSVDFGDGRPRIIERIHRRLICTPSDRQAFGNQRRELGAQTVAILQP